MSQQVKKIVKRSEDFAKWYTSIIQESKLIQYYDVKGAMIYQPYGWAIWELIKSELDEKLKATGSKNLYMPTLIPISEFEKEKDHVEGFSPELFTITQIGDTTLSEKLAIRPTSEIVFCKYWKASIRSYKDLPVKHNQWVSVFRAEKTTKPFLRNSEFHWHELHGLFPNKTEALAYAHQIHELYSDFISNELCIANLKGEKTIGERFAGAMNTFTIETIMQDNQALQSATSHYLGDNFTNAYGVSYQNQDNTIAIPHSTSHGLSTRIIGAIIMVHADDNGLVLPFKIAPIQVIILPLFASKNPDVMKLAQHLQSTLKTKYRAEIDESDKGLGFMISENQIKGIPFQVIIGPNNSQNNTVTIFRRDTNEKIDIAINKVSDYIEFEAKKYNENLFRKSQERLNNAIVEVSNFDEFKETIANGKWACCYFSTNPEQEKQIKELTGATARCIVRVETEKKPCFFSNELTEYKVIFARAY